MRIPGFRMRGMGKQDGQGSRKFLPSCTRDPCTESGRIRARVSTSRARFLKTPMRGFSAPRRSLGANPTVASRQHQATAVNTGQHVLGPALRGARG